MAFAYTPGSTDDRQPVESMTLRLCGKILGNKAYISQKLFHNLYERGGKLITHIRKNMKNKLITIEETVLLRERSLIETVNDQLKNVCQIEHIRDRNPPKFAVHLLASLIA